MTKNLGTSVSGYNNPDGRAWETVVFQSNKPVLDRELNLNGDVDSGSVQSALKRLMPSGWIADDFLGSSSTTSAIFSATTAVNTLEIPKLLAHVNGWLIPVESSNATTVNRLNLGTAPSGVGSNRTELVVLEVWRRLISAAPSTVGKSPSNRIWRNGNVKVTDDLALNLPDDILDANVNNETTKRVQIQYRLRVVSGVDIAAHPYGMSAPNVVAHTVPPDAATPDGTPYAGPSSFYENQSANGDPGLWRAGDGSPANGLGTVDGYIYAIPLCAVFRRNSDAFSRLNNQNGAGASPTSGRPDGLFHDIIASLDVLDLRSGVSPTGWALDEVLAKNFNFLLDNGLRQEVVDTHPDGGGCIGTTVLRANEIGGNPTSAGERIGRFDSIRRRFSDRAIYETVMLRYPAPGGSWADGAVVTIDPSSLPVYPYTTSVAWASMAPEDAQILDVIDMFWVGSAANSEYESAIQYVTAITGIGTRPATSVSINFGGVSGLGLTNEGLYILVAIAYPRDCGLSHTPVASYGSESFELVTGPLSGAGVDFAAFSAQEIDAAHREVRLEYTTTEQVFAFGSGGQGAQLFVMPERVESIISVTTTPAQSGPPTVESDGRTIILESHPNPYTLVTVRYVASRPIPAAANAKMAVYYRSAAPATVERTLLGTTLTAVPRVISDKLLTITAGSGSQGESYPFPQAYVQTGGVYPGAANLSSYAGESSLSASASISVANFSADTGMLMLPTYIPMVANPEGFSFSRSTDDVDIEDRTYFPIVPSGYIPNAYAQDFSSAGRHKNVFPVLAELAEDSTFGFKGQLVLILLVRYAAFDDDNGVFFDSAFPASNTTSASVIRVKGLLLNKRAS